MSHAHRTRRAAARPAYTLVEVLIVVTIIGIAGAIVVPHMLRASTLGIQAGARMLIADLLYAQNEAVVQQKTRGVTIDTDNERYWLTDENGDKLKLAWRTGDGVVDFIKDSRFRGITLAKAAGADGSFTFTQDDGLIKIEFDELGTPSAGGHIGLIAGAQRLVVSVADFTGRVTVTSVD